MIYNSELIMESDGDCEIVASIVIGNDILGNLVIQLEYNDYGNDFPTGTSYPSCKATTAVIERDSMERMARKLHLPVKELTNHLIRKFYDGGYISRNAYVRRCFGKMLDYVLDQQGKYYLK